MNVIPTKRCFFDRFRIELGGRENRRLFGDFEGLLTLSKRDVNESGIGDSPF